MAVAKKLTGLQGRKRGGGRKVGITYTRGQAKAYSNQHIAAV